jgi:hypothetical protein
MSVKGSGADRKPLGVRISPEAIRLLAALQDHYGAPAGKTASQSEAVERMIRETVKREGLKVKGIK